MKTDKNNIFTKNLILLVCGRFVSELGSSIFGFALSLYVLDYTNSAAAFSLVLSFSMLPNMIISLFAGTFVDRHNKKSIIVFCDIVSGILTLIFVAVFRFVPKTIIILIIYRIILSVIQAFFGIAITAGVPEMVGEKNTARVNSLTTTLGSIINILGPVLGAIAYKTIGLYWLIIVDGVSFIFSGISESWIVVKKNKEKREIYVQNNNYLKEVKIGFAYIAKNHLTMFFLGVSLAIDLIIMPVASVVLPYINYNVLKVTGLQLSIIQAAWASGAIIGGFLLSLKKDTFSLIRHIFSIVMVEAILLISFCFPKLSFSGFESKWVIAIIFSVLLIIFGIVNLMHNIPLFTYFQVQVPGEMRGRMYAIFNVNTMLASSVGLWILGFALEYIDWSILLCISGAILLALSIMLKRYKPFITFTKTFDQKEEAVSEEEIQ